MREIKILEAIKGGKYTLNLLRPCYDKMSRSICLVRVLGELWLFFEHEKVNLLISKHEEFAHFNSQDFRVHR